MKNKIITAACLLSTSVLLGSCTFLDLNPNGKLDETTVLTDAILAENYVVQAYADAYCFYDIYATAYVSDECMVTSDNQYSWDIQTQGKMDADQFPGAGTNNGNPVWIWPQTYATIARINKFFEYADNMTGNAELKKQLIGEMHFLRGFYYMELMKRFGGVPIITRVFSLDDSHMYDVTRASYADCVKFVCEEFRLAAEALPYEYGLSRLGRATKGAALGYKARLLLYSVSPQWKDQSGVTAQEAADAALAVIDLKDENGKVMYDLEPRFEDVFYNSRTKEAVFIRVHDQTNPGQTSNYFTGWGSPAGWGGYSIMSVSQGLVDAFEFAARKMPTADLYDGEFTDFAKKSESEIRQAMTSGKYYNTGTSPYDGRDPRFYASIACDGMTLFPGTSMEGTVDSFIFPDLKTGGSDSRLGSSWWNGSWTSYSCRKLLDEKSLTGVWTSGSNKPCIYMRLAEVYLNYAEASYWAGDESNARMYLNKVRERARRSSTVPNMLPDVNDSGDALLKAIQQERRVELAFEDHRYYDVRRWGIAETTESKPIRGMQVIKEGPNSENRFYLLNTAQPRVFVSPNYNLYPIPNGERRKNPKLDQNPGYGGM